MQQAYLVWFTVVISEVQHKSPFILMLTSCESCYQSCRCLHVFAGGQTNPEHLRQIYQAHLMLQLRVQEAGEYQQPEVIMTAARAVGHAPLISKTQHHACVNARMRDCWLFLVSEQRR